MPGPVNQRRYSLLAGVAGMLGAAACSLSMLLVVSGLVGVGVTVGASSVSMSGLSPMIGSSASHGAKKPVSRSRLVSAVVECAAHRLLMAVDSLFS